jgi:hypothetical protein
MSAMNSIAHNISNDFGVVLLVIGALIVFVLGIWWHYSRCSSLLEGWARRHGYQMVRQEYCHFFKGPFFWTSTKSQVVYFVTVLDREGRQRTGWVRLGGYFLGLFSDNVEVRWEH